MDHSKDTWTGHSFPEKLTSDPWSRRWLCFGIEQSASNFCSYLRHRYSVSLDRQTYVVKGFMKCLIVGAEVSPAGNTLALVVDASAFVGLVVVVVGGRLLVLVAIVQDMVVVVVVGGLGGLLGLVVLLLLGGATVAGGLVVHIGLSGDILKIWEIVVLLQQYLFIPRIKLLHRKLQILHELIVN